MQTPTLPTTYKWRPLDKSNPHEAQLVKLGVYLQVREGPRDPFVPDLDPAYVFRKEPLQEISFCAFPPDGMRPRAPIFSGPTGSGKSSIIRQVAARLNVPVFSFNMNVGTTVRALKGKTGARDGRTVYQPSQVIRAMERGSWVLFDELAAVTPPVAMALFPILEHDGQVLLEDDEDQRYVNRHPDFRIFATDNTLGADQADSRFRYRGAGGATMNQALLGRFGGLIHIGYLSQEDEQRAILGAVPGMIDAFVKPNSKDREEGAKVISEGMIRAFTALRASDLPFAFSTRALINWAERATVGHRGSDGQHKPLDPLGILDAACPAFLNSMDNVADRETALEIISRLFDPEGKRKKQERP